MRLPAPSRLLAGAAGIIVVLATGIFLLRSLTSDEVRAKPPVEPRPAPATAGSLAYVLDGDVYVADPDGSNAVKIADGRSAKDCYGWSGEYWTEGGLWSPDGRYLAFLRFTDCPPRSPGVQEPWDAVISDARGNVLATFPVTGWKPAWSPDSTRLAVWETWPETIGVYGLDGALQTQLTMPGGSGGGGDNDPVWMRGGASLQAGNMELPLDGGTPRRLSWEPDSHSPDGSQMVYTDRDRGGSWMIARSDGSEPRELLGEEAGDLVWSPTGDRIAFNRNGLRVLDVATGSVTRVTEGEHEVELGVIGFSPQGDRILFSRTKARGTGETSSLWSIGVDGSDARLIVAGTQYGEWLSR